MTRCPIVPAVLLAILAGCSSHRVHHHSARSGAAAETPRRPGWQRAAHAETRRRAPAPPATGGKPGHRPESPAATSADAGGPVWVYRYYPEAQVYYAPDRKTWYWRQSRRWRTGPKTPDGIRVEPRNSVIIEIDAPEPFAHFAEVMAKRAAREEAARRAAEAKAAAQAAKKEAAHRAAQEKAPAHAAVHDDAEDGDR